VNDLALRTHPELLVDSRGHALRASWHPADREVVIGVWDDRRCVGTVRLDAPAAARLGAFLVASLGAAVDAAVGVDGAGAATAPAPWTLRWVATWHRLRAWWVARLNR
jgi:hypothetical protein